MADNESYIGRIQRKADQKRHIIETAAGRKPADLVLKNASYVNVFTHEISSGDIAVVEGYIAGIGEYSGKYEVDVSGLLVLPGFIDAHIHLESSLVAPCEFAKAVLPHGTTTVITDPHEIANVMGVDGIEYMLQATEGLPVDVYFMLPSCVPATPMDEGGAELDYLSIDPFYAHPRVRGLAEMMNYPGVVGSHPQVLRKLVAAQGHHKRIDGHAPGLSGNDLNAYIASGVLSDHECSTFEEAMDKLRMGQHIMIREGTAAHNLKALRPLLTERYVDRCMFCCDDKHPLDLLKKGHIDYIIHEAISQGVDPILAVKAATCNSAQYLHLEDRGAIAPGYLADLVVIDGFEHFQIQQVYRKGIVMYDGQCLRPFEMPEISPALSSRAHNTIHISKLTSDDFAVTHPCGTIGLIAGEITSEDRGYSDHIQIEKDILKVAVIERHNHTNHIGIGYLQGYGLKSGAVATSVAHDSHNIIVVGTNESDMAVAVNRIAENNGGIVVVDHSSVKSEVILSIAGIMSSDTLENVNTALEGAKESAFALGVNHKIDPFMTLSFMSLPVIPTLRITTQGVIDVIRQKYL